MTQSKRSGWQDPLPHIDPEKCDGCGLCVKVCSTGALGLDGGNAVVIAPERCWYSGHCEIACPRHAIHRPLEIVVKAEEDSSNQERP